MGQLKKYHSLKLSYFRVLLACISGYGYATWLSVVLAEWLPFAQAENVYFAVFISFIVYIAYVVLISSMLSKVWFWLLNSLGILLCISTFV